MSSEKLNELHALLEALHVQRQTLAWDLNRPEKLTNEIERLEAIVSSTQAKIANLRDRLERGDVHLAHYEKRIKEVKAQIKREELMITASRKAKQIAKLQRAIADLQRTKLPPK